MVELLDPEAALRDSGRTRPPESRALPLACTACRRARRRARRLSSGHDPRVHGVHDPRHGEDARGRAGVARCSLVVRSEMSRKVPPPPQSSPSFTCKHPFPTSTASHLWSHRPASRRSRTVLEVQSAIHVRPSQPTLGHTPRPPRSPRPAPETEAGRAPATMPSSMRCGIVDPVLRLHPDCPGPDAPPFVPGTVAGPSAHSARPEQRHLPPPRRTSSCTNCLQASLGQLAQQVRPPPTAAHRRAEAFEATHRRLRAEAFEATHLRLRPSST